MRSYWSFWGHMWSSSKLLKNIFYDHLRCFDDHQIWPPNWLHYVWASLCQIPFYEPPPQCHFLTFWYLRNNSLKYFFDLLNVFSECIQWITSPSTSQLVKVSLPNIYQIDYYLKLLTLLSLGVSSSFAFSVSVPISASSSCNSGFSSFENKSSI